MTINEQKANYIANKIGINNGVIVNSGTIAILSALKLANIGINDNVLINGYCCYSLYEAIKNAGANPIIIVPKDFYNISYEELFDTIKKYNIKCFIAAHQYGIVQDIKKIKERFPDLIIIEDIAQAWNINYDNDSAFKYSDYVVTSFGLSKPLSFGQAGAVFSNNNLHDYFDFHDKDSRNMNNILLPYVLYECNNIDEMNLTKNADEIVEKQRIIAKYLIDYFINNENVTIHIDEDRNNSVWHKFPVVIKDKKYVEEFEYIMNKYNILFQWQNYNEVWELPMVKNTDTKIIQNNEKKVYALIKTRQNEIENIKRLVG